MLWFVIAHKLFNLSWVNWATWVENIHKYLMEIRNYKNFRPPNKVHSLSLIQKWGVVH